MEGAIPKNITIHEQGRISVMNIRKNSFDSQSLCYLLMYFAKGDSEIPAGKTW